MTIGELSAQCGLAASTIRYWEKIGVLPESARVSGQRRYSADAVSRVAVLQLAQACGFRLEEARQLLNGFDAGVKPARRWEALAWRKREEIDAQIARLKAMRRMVDGAGCGVVDCVCDGADTSGVGGGGARVCRVWRGLYIGFVVVDVGGGGYATGPQGCGGGRVVPWRGQRLFCWGRGGNR